MKNCIFAYSFLVFILAVSCTASESETQENQEAEDKENLPIILSNSNSTEDTNSNTEITEKVKKEYKVAEKEFKEEKAKAKLMSPQMLLLSKLDKNAKIEFIKPDYTIIKNDTLIKSAEDTFEISYTTACLNDSLIAQEMHDFGKSNKKNYLISHNYRTNVAVRVNGKVTGTREIKKELFSDRVDKEFLEKSIIKHPQFVRFDEGKKEAVFEFMVGVPNTDWLVIAGINMQQDGKLRIIEIIAPGM